MKAQDQDGKSWPRPEAVLLAALCASLDKAPAGTAVRAGDILERGLNTSYDDLGEKLAVIVRPDFGPTDRILSMWLAYLAILRPEMSAVPFWLGPAMCGDDDEEALRLGPAPGQDLDLLRRDLAFMAASVDAGLECLAAPLPDGGAKFSLRPRS